jgi:ribosomal protein S18 acetylase RimI-like enzyme
LKRRRKARPIRVTLRRGQMHDLAALVTVELAVFNSDVISRRSFRRFVASTRASLIVAEESGGLAGYVLVLYPSRSKLARLYSIAIAPHLGGRGLGPRLWTAAETAAKRRGRKVMRLEVDVRNKRAIARYQKSGYRLFGKHRDYYDDHGDALRFEKPIGRPLNA